MRNNRSVPFENNGSWHVSDERGRK